MINEISIGNFYLYFSGSRFGMDRALRRMKDQSPSAMRKSMSASAVSIVPLKSIS